MNELARFRDPDDSPAVQYGIDPDEWAQAAYESHLTAGATHEQARAAGLEARRYLLEEMPYQRWVLHRLTPDEEERKP